MTECSEKDCHNAVKSRGMCKKHYDAFMKRERRGGYLSIGDFCKKGHKIEGNNVQEYQNKGVTRVRCRECNTLKSMKPVAMGDVCIYGHKIEGDNVRWIPDQRTGVKRLRCRKCYVERNMRYYNRVKDTPEHAERKRIAMEREIARKHESLARAERYDKILAQEVGQSAGSYTGLNYLKLNKRAQRAWEPLQNMFDQTRSFCYKNPADYIDYDEDNIPSKYHAYELCNGCPMLVECGRFANAYKPVIGVWAGEVWVDGKVVGK